MHPLLLIDFGSTYTKVTAVDTDTSKLLGTASAYTTVETDINEGLKKALTALEKKTGISHYEEKLACSSAAGGLRMVACGLVPSLTEKAARLACFGAGAKVIKSYAYGLTENDIKEIESIKPDILLLAGGTDGGNTKNILHNATMLADCKIEFPILLAGNRNAISDCEKLLKSRSEVYSCENVMPNFEVLNTAPVQEQIREIFLKKIVKAKGLDKVSQTMTELLMPTPAAMLTALELLASGHGQDQGLGDLLAVDLGGATTDVYSLAKGLPKKENVIVKGLQEPYAKRTVEGDIGMRYSIEGIVDAVGTNWIVKNSELRPEQVVKYINYLSENPGMLPTSDELIKLDRVLASSAVKVAVNRHVGTIEEVYTPMGLAYSQTGKDLTDVQTLILTGGSIIHDTEPDSVIRQMLFDEGEPAVLKPKIAKAYMDQKYILATMGLLAKKYPKVALTIMKKELKTYELKE